METGISLTQNQMQSLKPMPVMPLIASLIKNDPQALVMIESELTIPKAMESIHIKTLALIMGKENTIKAILFLLTRFSQNFNVGKNINDDQALILSLDLFEKFQHETLEDIVLMLKYARQGSLGNDKVFNLDGQTFHLNWIPAYLELKAGERERRHTENKGNKNGMVNFNWKKEDVDKLKLSNKTETIRQGLGSRLKEIIGNPDNIL